MEIICRSDNKTPPFRDKNLHHLYFSNIKGQDAAWCSDPVPAKVKGDLYIPKLLTPKQLFKLIKANYLLTIGESEEVLHIDEVDIVEEDFEEESFMKYMRCLPSCSRCTSSDLI